MKLWGEGDRVRWTNHGALETAAAGDVRRGVVAWCRAMPASPAAIRECLAVLRRLRGEKRRGVPSPRAVLAVGRGVLVLARDGQGKPRVFVPWLKRLRPDVEAGTAQGEMFEEAGR